MRLPPGQDQLPRSKAARRGNEKNAPANVATISWYARVSRVSRTTDRLVLFQAMLRLNRDVHEFFMFP